MRYSQRITGLCLAVLCCISILPILSRVASLALGHSYGCPSVSEATPTDWGKWMYVPFWLAFKVSISLAKRADTNLQLSSAIVLFSCQSRVCFCVFPVISYSPLVRVSLLLSRFNLFVWLGGHLKSICCHGTTKKTLSNGSEPSHWRVSPFGW